MSSQLSAPQITAHKVSSKISRIGCNFFRSIRGSLPDTENHSIIQSLVDLGFALETANKFKNKYGVKKIERNIAYTLAKKQEGAVKDIPAYLNKAIEADWGGAWDAENKKVIQLKKKILEAENAKKAEIERKSLAEKQANDQLIENFFLLPVEKRTATIVEFLKSLDSISKKSQTKKIELLGEDAINQNKILRALFVNFLKKY